jgi:hypothetical protein
LASKVQPVRVQIVESQVDLDMLVSNIMTDDVLIDVVCVDAEKHCMNNTVSLLFFYFVASEACACLPINHQEAVAIVGGTEKLNNALQATKRRKFVWNKKNVVQLFRGDHGLVDITVLKFLNDGEIDAAEYTTNAHNFVNQNFRNVPDTNGCVPLYKHARVFLEKVEYFKKIKLDGIDDPGFRFVNDTMTCCFAKLESNGLCVNNDFVDHFGDNQAKHIKGNLVFSQYNFLTSTGRPSNRFAGVNYAALKKEDQSRSCFVTRYGSDGMLVLMDYNAFHPRLIAHLANFHMPASENPYAYLAKYFFDKKEVDEEDIAVSKAYTFPQIYGGIDKKWLHVPYLAKAQEYIDHRWKFYTENGYVETPKYKRKIRPCHIQEANPSKLFNYILQAYETEMAVDVLSDLLIQLDGKKTMPVLYTYDSILFDAHKEDGIDTIKKIKKIMERDNLPVKVYVGKSYKDMKVVSLS